MGEAGGVVGRRGGGRATGTTMVAWCWRCWRRWRWRWRWRWRTHHEEEVWVELDVVALVERAALGGARVEGARLVEQLEALVAAAVLVRGDQRRRQRELGCLLGGSLTCGARATERD